MKTITLATALALTGASAHAATFVGDTANFVISAFGGTSVQTDVTVEIVDPGVEATFSTDTIDVSATTIDIFYNLTSFGSVGGDLTWDIFGLDTDDGSIIDGVTLTSGNAADVLGISWTDDSISIQIADLLNPPETHAFSFAVSTSIAAVPLPAAFPMLALALGGLGMARRQRRN